MTSPARQRGPLPRTPPKPQAKLRTAVKSSPTGPREARRQAVPLDGRAQRSYRHPPTGHQHPSIRLINVDGSIKESETPQIDTAIELDRLRRSPPR
jgi:hypothetical protein